MPAPPPITRASGLRQVVLARAVGNRRLATACHLWAFAALTGSPGARRYYDAHRARGATHHQAMRADQDWDRALGLEQTAGLLLLPKGPPPGLRPWPGVELLDRDRVAELVPELVSMPAGLLAHDQTRVHPLRLAAALARRAGSVATGVAMTDLEVSGGRILRVRTTAGDLHPGVVVFATGLAPDPWVRVPQRLVKGHLVVTEPVSFRLACGVHSPGLGVGSMADGGLWSAAPARRATTPPRSAPRSSGASGGGSLSCSRPPPNSACATSGVAFAQPPPTVSP